jgi:hypothetical protein
VQELAPALFDLVPTRRKNTRKVSEALQHNGWLSDIAGTLDQEAARQCVQLWLALGEIHLQPDISDSLSWKGAKSGGYTAKDTYRLLCLGGVKFSLHRPIWRARAPLKCKIFLWLASLNRLWTADRRFRHGLQDRTSACFTCLQEEDTAQHILGHCVYAREVWYLCLTGIGLSIAEPQRNISFEDWWLTTRSFIRKEDRKRFDSLVILVAWMLWKQRNARVFGNTREYCNVRQLVSRIREEFRVWEQAFLGDRRVMGRE